MPDPTADAANAADAALDAELRRIAEALVAEAPNEIPPFPDDPFVVVPGTRGATFRRRPRMRAVAAAAAVLVAAGAVALIVAGETGGGDAAGDGAVSFIAADAGLEPAPQRLLLDEGTRELLPDGEIVQLELAGLDGRVRPLPGGGHVVVGAHPAPDPLPDDFDEFTDLTYGLAVVDADGEIEIERDIDRSVLLGVTDTEAILGREPTEPTEPDDERGRPTGPATILVHDLETGTERVVSEVDLDPDANVSAQWAIVGSDLVSVESRQDTQPSSEDCTLRVTDLATGDESARPLGLGCRSIAGLQVAPDGRQAAVAYEDLSGRWPEQRLAVIDLADGTVVDDELLGNDISCPAGDGICPAEVESVFYRGMAWSDATTVRVALEDLDAPFHPIDVRTVTVG